MAGGVRGAGGPALGRHLANAEKNEIVVVLEGRGLVSTGIRDQLAELTRLGSHARTRAPLYHVHADPPPDRPWTPDERAEYWRAFEKEFGLEDRPFAAVLHVKDGREHEHRVYLRVRADGTAIRLDHDHARREKLGRTFEFSRGERLTPGAHNRPVIAALAREGRDDVAAAMTAAGLDTMPRPRASTTPRERAQAERTATDPSAVRAAALAAWRASDGGAAFRAALAERGLRLARGDSTPQLVDEAGGTHDLRRALAAAAKAEGATDKITAAAVRAKLAGLDLPAVADARQAPAPVPAAPPEPGIPPAPVDPAEAALPVPETPTQTQGEHDASIPDPAPAEAEDLVGRADRVPDGRHDARRPDSGNPTRDGLPGDDTDVVRGSEDGPQDRVPDRPAELARPAGTGGADPARSGDLPPRGHRGGADPDGEAHGRHRVQARRALRGIAAAAGHREASLARLTAALHRPPTPEGLLAEALAASDEGAAQVLAGGPWPDPRTRSARLIAGDMHEDRMDASREADRRAEAARAEADAARGRIGFLDRLAGVLGVRTAAVRDADEAEARAARAEAACDTGPELREDLARLDGHARGVARDREAERKAWSQRPEVVAARREVRGNDLVRTAVAAGDFRIAHLAAADLPATREAMFRREADRIALEGRQRCEAALRATARAEPERLAVAAGRPRR